MKHLLTLLCFFSLLSINAQEKKIETKVERQQRYIDEVNPFRRFGYTPKIGTLSNGKYREAYPDTIVQIGSFSYNKLLKQVVGVIEIDESQDSEATLKPHLASRWFSPDPLSSEFPEWSPYDFVNNNPIRYIDPNGLAPEDIVVTTKGGKELFRLDDGKTAITKITAKQAYKRGIQWFSPQADNYTPLKSVASGISSFPEIKHFSWENIADFSEENRTNFAYRSGASGDWKQVEGGADGYLLSEVDGQPYWSDALGQIPFSVDTTLDGLRKGMSEDQAIMNTLSVGRQFGDGSLSSGGSDNTNSYDNSLILRAAIWTTNKYDSKLESTYHNARNGTTTNKYSLKSNGAPAGGLGVSLTGEQAKKYGL